MGPALLDVALTTNLSIEHVLEIGTYLERSNVYGIWIVKTLSVDKIDFRFGQ